jgi:hypothetical protein
MIRSHSLSKAFFCYEINVWLSTLREISFAFLICEGWRQSSFAITITCKSCFEAASIDKFGKNYPTRNSRCSQLDLACTIPWGQDPGHALHALSSYRTIWLVTIMSISYYSYQYMGISVSNSVLNPTRYWGFLRKIPYNLHLCALIFNELVTHKCWSIHSFRFEGIWALKNIWNWLQFSRTLVFLDKYARI